MADGTVVGIDVTFVGGGASAKEVIRRKTHGWGTPRDRRRAMDSRAETAERVREAVENKEVEAREAQEARLKAALKVESAYHSGYKRPLELGGATFVCGALSFYGGWHAGAGDVLSRVTHSGDREGHNSWEERFEHPARTWASVTHRQFTLQAVAVATAEATYTWVEEKCRRVMREVLGERAKENVLVATPPRAEARQTDAIDSDGDGRAGEAT